MRKPRWIARVLDQIADALEKGHPSPAVARKERRPKWPPRESPVTRLSRTRDVHGVPLREYQHYVLREFATEYNVDILRCEMVKDLSQPDPLRVTIELSDGRSLSVTGVSENEAYYRLSELLNRAPQTRSRSREKEKLDE